MSFNKKYLAEQRTYSEEGLKGALTGAGVSFVAGMLLPGIGTTMVGGAVRAKATSLKKEIEYISEQIYKARLGEIKAAERDGVEVPADIKKFSTGEIIKGAVYGFFFGPFYGGYKGSEIEDLNEELKAKIAELEAVLKNNEG